MIHFNREEWTSLIVVFGLAGLMQFFDYHGWLAGPEGRITDWRLSAAGEKSDASPVVLVEIDDTAYDVCFDSVSPMYAKRVKGLIEGVHHALPAVIGIDIMTAARIRAADYQTIAEDLRPLSSKLVWISGIRNSEFEIANFGNWLLGKEDEVTVESSPVLGFDDRELKAHPEILWGVPVFPPDQDTGLRRFPRRVRLSGDPQPEPSWASLIAAKYCAHHACKQQRADEVILSYNVNRPYEFTTPELFDCDGNPRLEEPRWREFKARAENKIVLVGGTFPESGDFHRTAAGHRTPGLLVNAYAIQAEIDGSGVEEVKRPWAVAFDILIGLILTRVLPFLEWLVHKWHGSWLSKQVKASPFRWMVSGSLLLIAGAVVLSSYLFGKGYLLSLLGVAIGVLVHDLVEMWLIDPKLMK